MYAKACNWSESVSFGRANHQLEIVSDFLNQRVQLLLTQFAEWTTTLQNHYNRILVLRQLKAKNLEDWSEARGDVDLGQSETMSEASTMSNVSRMSTASSASSRRRKTVRVLWCSY